MLQAVSIYTSARSAHPSAQQGMASQTLGSRVGHGHLVRSVEIKSRITDMMRGDFLAFQSALTTLEKYFQALWCTMNLDPNIRGPLGALLTEQKKDCEVTSLLLDNIAGRYDRFLNLVSYLHRRSNWCIIQNAYSC